MFQMEIRFQDVMLVLPQIRSYWGIKTKNKPPTTQIMTHHYNSKKKRICKKIRTRSRSRSLKFISRVACRRERSGKSLTGLRSHELYLHEVTTALCPAGFETVSAPLRFVAFVV
jgi:hypothetical protein